MRSGQEPLQTQTETHFLRKTFLLPSNEEELTEKMKFLRFKSKETRTSSLTLEEVRCSIYDVAWRNKQTADANDSRALPLRKLIPGPVLTRWLHRFPAAAGSRPLDAPKPGRN